MWAVFGQVAVNPLPFRLDPPLYVLAHRLGIALAGRLMRIPPLPEQRLHHVGEIEHPLGVVHPLRFR